MERRIMIFGCGGMLGDAVYKHFSKENIVDATDIDLSSPWVRYQDITDYAGVVSRINQFHPTEIINLAAKTDMEMCELNPDEAEDVNSFAASFLADMCSEYDLPYVYISTAGIFGGEKEYFSDEDEPNPLSVYARTKYMGELSARSIPQHYVIRAGWMMGGGPEKDKKFINKIFKLIKAGSTELNVVDDKAGTPTYTVDFAKGIDALLKSKKFGVYNQVCSGSCTRYDVACEFVRLLGANVTVNRVDSSFWSKEYFAPRPLSEKLLPNRLIKEGLYVMRDWKTCLAEYAEEFKCKNPTE